MNPLKFQIPSGIIKTFLFAGLLLWSVRGYSLRIQVRIQHFTDSVITLQNPLELPQKAIKLKGKEGIFTGNIRLTHPVYVDLLAGKESVRLYLKPGEAMGLEADADQWSASLKATGSGALENNYLFGFRNYCEAKNLMPMGSIRFYLFDSRYFRDTMRVVQKDFLSYHNDYKRANPGTDSVFLRLELEKIKVLFKSALWQYSIWHPLAMPSDTGSIPADFFPLPITQFDHALSELPEYYQLIKLYLDVKSLQVYPVKRWPMQWVELFKAMSPTAEETQKMWRVAAEGLFNERNPNPKTMLELMKTADSDTALHHFLEAQYEKLRGLEPGAPAPVFSGTDPQGHVWKLDSLKGKIIYIDVWATWCKPCRDEIPFMEKLKAEYRNQPIAFLSISVDAVSDRERWVKFMESHGMSGAQWLAEADWSSEVIKKYRIRGIPHFILIDEAFNLLMADAPRPSEKVLRLFLNDQLEH